METVIKCMEYGILFFFLYGVIMSLFSLYIKKEKNKGVYEQTNSFSVLIPCHNEDQVIFDNLQSIYDSSYDKSLLNIYVICDNCTDQTVEIVNAFKYSHMNMNVHCLEVNGGSKPKALKECTKILRNNNLWVDDNIVVLDADNRISPSLFDTFNREIQNGSKIVQVSIQPLNNKSFVAKGFTSAFNNMNRSYQYARNVLNLSGSLCGTGYSVNREVWDKVGFDDCNTLTEDFEASIMSILKGYKIKFIYNDYVLNQHLDSFHKADVQRTRWARGSMQVCVKMFPKTLWSFIKKPSLQKLDIMVFMTTGIRYVVYMVCIAFEIIYGKGVNVPFKLALIPTVIYAIMVMVCNKWSPKYILPHIWYYVSMMFVTSYGCITFWKNNWTKTIHVKQPK